MHLIALLVLSSLPSGPAPASALPPDQCSPTLVRPIKVDSDRRAQGQASPRHALVSPRPALPGPLRPPISLRAPAVAVTSSWTPSPPTWESASWTAARGSRPRLRSSRPSRSGTSTSTATRRRWTTCPVARRRARWTSSRRRRRGRGMLPPPWCRRTTLASRKMKSQSTYVTNPLCPSIPQLVCQIGGSLLLSLTRALAVAARFPDGSAPHRQEEEQ